jgi:uncharacterized small protein (DUF1192 family)
MAPGGPSTKTLEDRIAVLESELAQCKKEKATLEKELQPGM